MTQELSAEEKATVARMGIHDDAGRIKVWCINWTHPDAPHAVVGVLRNGELVGDRYFPRWSEAIAYGEDLARRLADAEGGIR